MRLPSFSPRHSVGNDRGTSTIEFLVVLPFLLLIMLASVEFSRAFMTVNLATTAAREGARWGAVSAPGAVKGVGEGRIAQILTAGGAACSSALGCSVNCDPSPCDIDSRVVADVNVTFQTIVPVFLPSLTSINLNQSASMRYEGAVP
jgi:Flp pilus assembly protein TadG